MHKNAETPESIVLAAAALRGEDNVTVAKAADVIEGEEAEVEVAKAAPAEEAPSLADIVRAAVASELAPIKEELVEARKAVEVANANTQAIMEFQGATTEVLKGLKANVVDLQVVTDEQVEVQKATAAKVEEVANQPAGRRTPVLDVQKSLSPAPVALDTRPLREWLLAEGKPSHERTAWVVAAKEGDYTGIPANVQKAMGVL